MKNLETWLNENGYEYECTRFGSNGYSVPGILIAFYYDGIGNSREQWEMFEKYVKSHRKSKVEYKRFAGGAMVTYHIMLKDDAAALEAYDKKRLAEVEAYWQAKRAEENRKTA